MNRVHTKLLLILSLLVAVMLLVACGDDEPEDTILTGEDVIVVEGVDTEGVEDAEIATEEDAVVEDLVVTPDVPATPTDLAITPTPSTAFQAGQAVTAQAVTAKASTLLGMDVENVQGEGLGELTDLVVDTGTGQIPYALLTSSGFLGFSGEDLLIPFTAFALSQAGNELILPFVSADQIENAPTVSADWPTWGDPAWADRGAAVWGATEFGEGLPAAGQSASALRLSALIGYGIGAYGDLGAGSIVDILVDLQANGAKWLVVDYAGAAASAGAASTVDYNTHLVLIPFAAMDWQNLGQEIFFNPNIDATAFAGAPLILRDEFEQAGFLNPNFDAEVVSYWQGYGVQFEDVNQ